MDYFFSSSSLPIYLSHHWPSGTDIIDPEILQRFCRECCSLLEPQKVRIRQLKQKKHTQKDDANPSSPSSSEERKANLRTQRRRQRRKRKKCRCGKTCLCGLRTEEVLNETLVRCSECEAVARFPGTTRRFRIQLRKDSKTALREAEAKVEQRTGQVSRQERMKAKMKDEDKIGLPPSLRPKPFSATPGPSLSTLGGGLGAFHESSAQETGEALPGAGAAAGGRGRRGEGILGKRRSADPSKGKSTQSIHAQQEQQKLHQQKNKKARQALLRQRQVSSKHRRQEKRGQESGGGLSGFASSLAQASRRKGVSSSSSPAASNQARKKKAKQSKSLYGLFQQFTKS